MPRGAMPVAIVTGAAGRVGSTVVARLQLDGFQVAGIDLRPSPGVLTLGLVTDVTDRAAVVAAVSTVVERLGPVSVLVTAADADDRVPFGEMDDVRWRRLLRVTLGGTGNACAAVLPGMLEAGGGTIVTLSSSEAVEGAAGSAYRAAATGTILAFTRSLAVEVAGRGVRVNCVAGGTPDGVAATVGFLVRDGGFYVGQVFAPTTPTTAAT